ncbi:MAG: metallophosphoesterase family protein [Polyangiaceae bacterium]|nr:metallophosphoesterase family protein [Polyangiaceae bacterium]
MRTPPWALAFAVALASSCSAEDSPGGGGAGGSGGGAGSGGEGGGVSADASVDAGGDAGPAACPTSPETTEPPAADPGTPSLPPTLDCGTPAFPAGSPLRRYPYLQAVDGASASILWTTTGGSSPTVRVAPSASGPWQSFAAATEAFPVSRTADSVDYEQHHAEVTGLGPGTAYCYEVLMDGQPVATNLRFETAFRERSRPVRVLAFGDSGSGSDDQKAVRDRFSQDGFDLFLGLGDLAYGSGTFVEFETNHFDIYRDFMHRVPHFGVLGNHEYKTDGGQPYLDMLHHWAQAWRPADQERYYSFDYGNVHFVALDSNPELLLPIQLDDLGGGSVKDDMVDWLRDDLARSTAEWKIAFFHHPPFTSSTRGDNAQLIATVLPVLEAAGVDFVLVGHDHHYERTHRMLGHCPTMPGGTRAIPYVIVGTGGAGIRDAAQGEPHAAKVIPLIHGYLRFVVHGCRGTGEFVDRTGAVLDSFQITGC